MTKNSLFIESMTESNYVSTKPIEAFKQWFRLRIIRQKENKARRPFNANCIKSWPTIIQNLQAHKQKEHANMAKKAFEMSEKIEKYRGIAEGQRTNEAQINRFNQQLIEFCKNNIVKAEVRPDQLIHKIQQSPYLLFDCRLRNQPAQVNFENQAEMASFQEQVRQFYIACLNWVYYRNTLKLT